MVNCSQSQQGDHPNGGQHLYNSIVQSVNSGSMPLEQGFYLMQKFKFKMYNNRLTDTELASVSKRDRRIIKRNYSLNQTQQVTTPVYDATAYCYNRKQLGNI